MTLFKGRLSDLPRIGEKKGHKESPGLRMRFWFPMEVGEQFGFQVFLESNFSTTNSNHKI